MKVQTELVEFVYAHSAALCSQVRQIHSFQFWITNLSRWENLNSNFYYRYSKTIHYNQNILSYAAKKVEI